MQRNTVSLLTETYDVGRAALQHLAAGDYRRCFRFADRLCRTTQSPRVESLLIRAEASYRLGYRRFALHDLDLALTISPDHEIANLRRLAWGDAAEKGQSARALLDAMPCTQIPPAALRTLLAENDAGLAHVTAELDHLVGWAIWQGAGRLTVTLLWQDGEDRAEWVRDPSHPLARWADNACSFSLLCVAAAASTVHVTIATDGRVIEEATCRFPALAVPRAAPPERRDHPSSREITVILPVHSDAPAVMRCLRSYEQQELGGRLKIIVVDDASEDAELKAGLRSWVEARRDAAFLQNRVNHGFAGAINRGLARVHGGDVVLLNSDTILAPGALRRLSEAAYAAPDVGTVTPLSNNGELTSFPRPFLPSPLPSYDAIVEIDRLCARENAGVQIDLPTGIGFCLYIRQDCLDQVGALSEKFGRGYFEDADFCLRAAALGFRNICAASVYVAHAGSHAFKSEKGSLVARNRPRLLAAFPDYEEKLAGFAAVDPLRPVRSRLGRAMNWSKEHRDLLVIGDARLAGVAERRAELAVRRKQNSAILTLRQSPRPGASIVLHGGGPRIEFDDEDDFGAALDFLKAQAFRRIELIGPGGIAPGLVTRLAGCAERLDIVIADGALAFDPSSTEPLCEGGENAPGAKQLARFYPGAARWQEIAGHASQLLAADPRAEGFAHEVLPSAIAHRVMQDDRETHQEREAGWRQGRPRNTIGVLPSGPSAAEHRLLHALSRRLRLSAPDLSLVILGTTINDFAFAGLPNIFPTGRVAPAEFERLLRQYEIDALFYPVQEPHFGDPAFFQGLESGLPIAYFDWTFGKIALGKADLRIPPSASPADLATQLAEWVAM